MRDVDRWTENEFGKQDWWDKTDWCLIFVVNAIVVGFIFITGAIVLGGILNMVC